MEILIIFLLLIINGLFSMSEIALVSARKSKLESAAKRGDKNAKIALETANSPNKFLSTVQIGITLIGILTGIFSGEKITDDVEHFILNFPSLQNYAHSIAVGIIVIVITFFSLVIGELVPKRIGLTNPETIAKIVARPMNFISTITSPFVWLLTFTSDILIKLFRIKPSTDSKVTEEEIKAIIQEGTDGGEIQEIEQDIVERVFILGDRKVSNLMTHRNDLVYLQLNQTAESIKTLVYQEMHSIYPVYDKDKDTLLGIVLLKDLFKHISDRNFNIKNYLKEPRYLTESQTAYDALKFFKESSIHYGFVTDEFGQVQGLITMSDLLETLVGDVSEFHSEDFIFNEREDGSILIDGQFPMHEFLVKLDLSELDQDFDFNTISGLILEELKTIPKEGDKLSWMNYEFEIMDMDGARIDKVLLRKVD